MSHTQNFPVSNQPKQLPLRDWQDGLCKCTTDTKSCVLTTFFCPCYLCHLYRRYDESILAACFTPVALLAIRTFHRGRQRIFGSICCDMLETIFCGPCVTCQLARDMKYVENMHGTLQV